MRNSWPHTLPRFPSINWEYVEPVVNFACPSLTCEFPVSDRHTTFFFFSPIRFFFSGVSSGLQKKKKKTKQDNKHETSSSPGSTLCVPAAGVFGNENLVAPKTSSKKNCLVLLYSFVFFFSFSVMHVIKEKGKICRGGRHCAKMKWCRRSHKRHF